MSMMEPVNILAARGALVRLVISDQTTAADADAATRVFAGFNQCNLGLVSFSGLTPWERHPDDELLYVLEGEIDVTILPAKGDAQALTLKPGNVFVVPKTLWHHQNAPNGATVLFATSKHGNDESLAEDPR